MYNGSWLACNIGCLNYGIGEAQLKRSGVVEYIFKDFGIVKDFQDSRFSLTKHNCKYIKISYGMILN